MLKLSEDADDDSISCELPTDRNPKHVNESEGDDNNDVSASKQARTESCDRPKSPMRYYPSKMEDTATKSMLEVAYDADCEDCNRRFSDPLMRNLVLHLHAWRYSGPDWTYTAPVPQWVSDQTSLAEVDVMSRVEELLSQL